MNVLQHSSAGDLIHARFKRLPAGMTRAISAGVKRDDHDGIDERSFRFYCDVLGFVDTIPRGPKTDKLIEQLAEAAGSICNNREEALGGSSRREFVRFNEIALRSANESVRWLRACCAKRLGDHAQATRLLDEGRQIAKIIAKIIITTKRNGLDPPGTTN